MRSEPVEAQLLEHLATKKLQKNLANNEIAFEKLIPEINFSYYFR